MLISDHERFVRRDDLPPPRTAGALVTDLGLQRAGHARRRAAIDAWLQRNEVSPDLLASLARRDLLLLPVDAYAAAVDGRKAAASPPPRPRMSVAAQNVARRLDHLLDAPSAALQRLLVDTVERLADAAPLLGAPSTGLLGEPTPQRTLGGPASPEALEGRQRPAVEVDDDEVRAVLADLASAPEEEWAAKVLQNAAVLRPETAGEARVVVDPLLGFLVERAGDTTTGTDTERAEWLEGQVSLARSVLDRAAAPRADAMADLVDGEVARLARSSSAWRRLLVDALRATADVELADDRREAVFRTRCELALADGSLDMAFGVWVLETLRSDWQVIYHHLRTIGGDRVRAATARHIAALAVESKLADDLAARAIDLRWLIDAAGAHSVDEAAAWHELLLEHRDPTGWADAAAQESIGVRLLQAFEASGSDARLGLAARDALERAVRSSDEAAAEVGTRLEALGLAVMSLVHAGLAPLDERALARDYVQTAIELTGSDSSERTRVEQVRATLFGDAPGSGA